MRLAPAGPSGSRPGRPDSSGIAHSRPGGKGADPGRRGHDREWNRQKVAEGERQAPEQRCRGQSRERQTDDASERERRPETAERRRPRHSMRVAGLAVPDHRTAERQAGHEHCEAKGRDRAEQERERHLDRRAREEAPGRRHSAHGAPGQQDVRRPASFGARYMPRNVRYRPTASAGREAAGSSPSEKLHGASAIISVMAGTPRNIRIAQASWKRLIGFKARQPEEPPILHVALAPAQVAGRELEHGRRVLLPASALRPAARAPRSRPCA